MDVGALTPPLWGFEEREKLMVFYERVSGSRMHAAYSGRAACTRDMPDRLVAISTRSADPFLKVVDDLDNLLTGNRIFKQRNVDYRHRQTRRRLELGFSGVMVRGSGAAWDLRKSQPYECYNELDFDIPIGRRRLLRPLSDPHGRDAAVDQDHEAVPREAAQRRRPRPVCRRRQQDRAAQRAEMSARWKR